jgi:hypothetical protein
MNADAASNSKNGPITRATANTARRVRVLDEVAGRE